VLGVNMGCIAAGASLRLGLSLCDVLILTELGWVLGAGCWVGAGISSGLRVTMCCRLRASFLGSRMRKVTHTPTVCLLDVATVGSGRAQGWTGLYWLRARLKVFIDVSVL